MHWDGKTWSVLPTPQPLPQAKNYLKPPYNTLTSVAAVATDDVWAVGSQYGQIPDPQHQYRNFLGTLAMHWDGITWSIVPSPHPSGFDQFMDIAAISNSELWAVGTTNNDMLVTRFVRSSCPGNKP
jgi:hypothetical protein